MNADQLQETAIALSYEAIDGMNSFLADLRDAAQREYDAFLNREPPVVRSPGFQYAWYNLPDISFDAVSMLAGTTPSVPALSAVASPALETAPEFTLAMPELNIPNAPSSTLPDAPAGAPDFNAPVMPTHPALVLPEVPRFDQLNLPEVPEFQLPAPMVELPDEDGLLDVTEHFNWSETQYSSELLDLVRAKLTGDLRNGGYGIEPEDEEALWDRAREREAAVLDEALEDALRAHAARGFPMPSGAVAQAFELARSQATTKNAELSREVMLRRSELYVQARQFALTTAASVENILVSYHSAVAERALNAARANVELGVALHNAKLAKLRLRLERYQIGLQGYEALVRGALAALETYKVRVEAARLDQDRNRLYAELYRAQLDAVRSLVDIYRTDMEAARVYAEIENMKLSAFRTRVEAYGTQVQAKAQEFSMFEAQVRGETAKLDAYRTGVQAYGARVDAYRTKVGASEIVLRSNLMINEQKLSRYREEVSSYRVDMERSFKIVDATLAGYGQRLERHRILASSAADAGREAILLSQANAQIAQSNAQTIAHWSVAQGSNLIALMNAKIGAASTGVKALADVATAAFSSANTLTASIVNESE